MLNKICRMLKIFLFKIDLFSSSQLLRYKKQTNYSTLTGGVLSLAIIIIFGTLLIQNSISVITFSKVISKDSIYYSLDPTYTSFNFDQTTPFMIAIGIPTLNLSSTQRYFDIVLSTQSFSYGKLVNQTFHNLQTCNYDQWARINQIGGKSYNSTKLSGYLCPTSDVRAQLEGKYTSQNFKFLKLKIAKCNNSTDPTRPCKDPSVVNQTGTYTVNYYFMNAYVNSGDLQPVNFYLQDRNYFGFTLNSTTSANIYLTQQVISTDNSLMPWESIDNQSVLLVNQLAQVKTSQSARDTYFSIYLRKSPYYILSQRNFQKLIDLFSNIGGLFGFVVTFFVFVQQYTQASYQIQMGDSLFYYNSGEPLKSKSFNFLYYILLCIYQLFHHFNINLPSQKLKQYFQCKQQVSQQLSLSLLMNKTTFLQKCMNALFEQHQFRAIYLQQKPTVGQAQALRRNHGLNKIIHNQSKKINDKIRGEVKRQKTKMIKNMLEIPKTESILVDRLSKQSQPKLETHRRQSQSAPQQKIPYDLMQVVANFIISQPSLARQPSIKISSEQSEKENQQNLQSVQLQRVAEENAESLKFINTALNDIKLVEEQSKRGNIVSKRIYRQLNNDITKEQFIVLKCLETIVARKSLQIQSGNNHEHMNEDQKDTIFDRIIKLGKKEEDKRGGLEIMLQTVERIKTNSDM